MCVCLLDHVHVLPNSTKLRVSVVRRCRASPHATDYSLLNYRQILSGIPIYVKACHAHLQLKSINVFFCGYLIQVRQKANCFFHEAKSRLNQGLELCLPISSPDNMGPDRGHNPRSVTFASLHPPKLVQTRPLTMQMF